MITGTRQQIIDQIESLRPGTTEEWLAVYDSLEHYEKREVLDHEGIYLYYLAAERQPQSVFEIGTCWGNSAAMLAVNSGWVFTCTPNPGHIPHARKNLEPFGNVTVIESRSQDLLDKWDGSYFDFIFVDGDHDAIEEDLPWWDRLMPRGLMLFHDYSPPGSGRPCRPVYQALNRFWEKLGRPPDVGIMDNNDVGMIGWVKGE